MAFTKTPVGAENNYLLTGTAGPDTTTIVNASGVTVQAFGDGDDVSVQNSSSSIFGYNVDLGDGDDRFQAVLDQAQIRQGAFAVQNSTILGGSGNDILLAASLNGLADAARTAYVLYSEINGNQGNDLIRLYGAISSFVGGGADQDTIELLTPGGGDLPNDRWSGSNIIGGSGQDLIRIDTRDRSVLSTVINGGADDDTFASGPAAFGGADVVSGDWTGTTVFGGSGNDTFFFADATSNLYLVGGDGADAINSGLGNDTIEGRNGVDTIVIAGGINLVYGQGSADIITIDGNGNNTVYGGAAGDAIVINGDGSNFVQGDDNVANAGADIITITGGGQNTVYGGDLGDTITLNTFGDSLVYAGNGADDVVTSDFGGGRFFLGAGHDTFVATTLASNSVSVYGGAGYDVIDAFNSDESIIQGGQQGDIVDFAGTAIGVLIQQDGESMEATAVASADQFWSNTDVITYDNGVDIVTGFVPGLTFLDTTLGDLGLDYRTDADGTLFDAAGLQVVDGMVVGQSYYLRGTWTYNPIDLSTPNDSDGFFTVDAVGADALIVTQGDNGPLTFNANSLVAIGVGATIEDITSVTVI